MKMILKLARLELRNLFYSPVAWFIAIAFFVQCAFMFTYTLQPLANWQDVYMKNQTNWPGWDFSLTLSFFSGSSGLAKNILDNLYLYVPLLTMGLINREINNGTIRLLYSSPISTRSIVLGKYVAIMAFNAILMLIFALVASLAIIVIDHAEIIFFFSVLLGFLLLLATYTAIGLFMSSLTTYQIVAALGTFFVLFALNSVSNLWQQYDFFRDLTYFLSLDGRADNMIDGLITTKDVIYFLLIIGMFVAFTIIKMQHGRESRHWLVPAGRYAFVFLLVLAVGYTFSRPALTGYWDTTRNKVNTLHERAQAILKGMDKDSLEVVVYANLLDGSFISGSPAERNQLLKIVWDKLIRFKPDIKFRFVNYYDHPRGENYAANKTLKEAAKEMARGFKLNFDRFLSPEEIRKEFNPQEENYRLVFKLNYKGRHVWLRTFPDGKFWPNDENKSAALKYLVNNDHPVVAYLTGNLERSIVKPGEREFLYHTLAKDIRTSLSNNGFEVRLLDLDETDIPSWVSAVVLADPKTALSPQKLERLQRYIDKGGNLMVLSEPGKQDIVNPLLKHIGVTLLPGTLVQITDYEVPDMVRPYISKAATVMAEDEYLLSWKAGEADSFFYKTPNAAGIDFTPVDSFRPLPVLVTSKNAVWSRVGKLVNDSIPPSLEPSLGDFKKDSFYVSLGLTRQIDGREQRILVSGETDFMSTLRQGGGLFGKAFYSWLCYNEQPVYLPEKKPIDIRTTIGPGAADALKIIFTYVLPGLLLVGASILLIRRKRQ